MDGKVIWLIVLIMTVIFFVPFYPFKLVKRIILYIFNKFVPLPIKFDDIGGIPIIGMRLFNVRISLGAAGTLEAEELHVKLRFMRMLVGRRPQFNPLTLYRPKIVLKQGKQKGDVWFLFPLNAMKQVAGVLFSNLTGLNIIRVYGGTITIEGKRGDTVMKDFNGEFTSHGSMMKLKRLSCNVGDGSIEIRYPPGNLREAQVVVRNLCLENLVALKVPKMLSGPVNIEAAMTGSVADLELQGSINSPCLYMLTEPIVDFRSPLNFKGTELTLEKMSGRVGEYTLGGKLITDVETDISDLLITGGGKGHAAASILRMLSLAPFISKSGLDARIHLWGDLNEFYDFHGDIELKLWDTEIDFTEMGQGTTLIPQQPIPEAFVHLKLDNGILKFEKCDLKANTFTMDASGKIEMIHDKELDKVTRSKFDMNINAECGDIKDIAAMFGLGRMKLEGAGKGNFSMYADYEDEFHELRGEGSLSFTDTRILSLPEKFFLERFIDVKFDNIDSDVYLEKEGMGFRNLKCIASWLDIAADGYLGFFTKEMNVDGNLSTVPGAVTRSKVFKMLPGAKLIADKLRMNFNYDSKDGGPKFSTNLFSELKRLMNRCDQSAEHSGGALPESGKED